MQAKQRIKSLIDSLLSPLQGIVIKAISHSTAELNIGNSGSSLVIGPGKECKKIWQIADKNYSAYYIANLNKKRFASGILKHFLKYKNGVVLVSAIDEEVVKFKDALWLHDKIKSVYIMAFNPNQCKDLASSLIRDREVKRLNKYGHSVCYLPPSLGVDFTTSLRNTGLVTIHLAASISDTVECIGYNFYASHNQEGTLEQAYGCKAASDVRSVSEDLWKLFYTVVDFWPDTQFVIYLEEIYSFIQERKNLKVVVLE